MEALQLEDPRTMGDYRLIGRLGAGGMGQVYLGRSRGGRMVAVKLVHANLAADPVFRQRFRHEVEAARRVGGQWTAPVLDADTESDEPWVATGYVPGPTLADTVERHGPLPELSVLALASGLARALQAVHAHRLIHRDLKPSNVMVTIDGPRVIDFGIARSVDAGVATRTGALIGSPAFMSPEQARGAEPSPAGDIFSLGSVLAYAATGRRPFGADVDNVHAVLLQVTQGDPQLGRLSGPVRTLVEACLAKAPEDRPTLEAILRSLPPFPRIWLPGEVATELGRHTAGLLDLETPDLEAAHAAPSPHPGPPGSGHTSTASFRRRPAPRRRLYPALGAVAAVVIAATTVIALTGDDGEATAGRNTGTKEQGTKDESVNGVVPPAMVGTWEGEVEQAGTETWWQRRITLSQGALGQDVARIIVAQEPGMFCEYVGRLASSSPAVDLRPRLTRSIPPGRCEDDPPQKMTLKGAQVHWAAGKVSGDLSRARHTAVPADLHGRWVGSDGNGLHREFDIGDGAVGTEAVRTRVGAPGGPACETAGVLVSADDPIIFLATRLISRTSGCSLNPALQAFKLEAQGLTWGYGDASNGDSAQLRRP